MGIKITSVGYLLHFIPKSAQLFYILFRQLIAAISQIQLDWTPVVFVFDYLSFLQVLLRFYIVSCKIKISIRKHIPGTKNRIQHVLSYENTTVKLQEFYKLTYMKCICPFVFQGVNMIKVFFNLACLFIIESALNLPKFSLCLSKK